MAKIIVTGSSGFVGSFLVKHFQKHHTVYGLSRSASPSTTHQIDLSDLQKTRDLFSELKPDIVIHSASLPNVNYCEDHEQEAAIPHVDVTQNVVAFTPDTAQLIFLSTDYVYDGKKPPYTEESAIAPVNVYGKLKAESENIISSHLNHLILRTTVIFGYHPGGFNFFMQLLSAQKEQKPMNIPTDQINNPTYIDLLVEGIDRSIQKQLKGLYHLTGTQSYSRYDFALALADAFDFDKKLLIPKSTPELGQIAPRPLNCTLNLSKIQQALEWEIPLLSHYLTKLKSVVSNSED